MEFRVYEAKDGWRWRLVAKNGRTVADSGEAYNGRGNAWRACKTVRKAMGAAPIVNVAIDEEEPA